MNMPDRTPLFYMANLDSEFVRVYRAFDQKNLSACRLAADRCFLIINKLKLSEEMQSRQQIEKYFNPFALRVTRG